MGNDASTHHEASENLTGRAEQILSNLGLTWDDLEKKKVLDVASGESALAASATLLGIETNIVSTDIEHPSSFPFPFDPRAKEKFIQADLNALPFPNESFDLIVSHGYPDGTLEVLKQASRILKTGGELRIYPLPNGEDLIIALYLQKLGWEYEEIAQKIQHLHQMEADLYDRGFDAFPTEYKELREKALENLSRDEQLEALEYGVSWRADVTELDLKARVIDREEYGPTVVLIYKKS